MHLEKMPFWPFHTVKTKGRPDVHLLHGCAPNQKRSPESGARIMDVMKEGKRHGAAAEKLVEQDFLALLDRPDRRRPGRAEYCQADII